MAPELALVYVIGWIPSATVTGCHLYFHRKKVRSPRYRQIQNNLKKANLLWRESVSNLEPYEEGKEERDLQNYEKNILLMGVAFFFLSWGGFIFNLIMFFSMNYLAVPRLERKIMESELGSGELSEEQVRVVLNELSSS